MKMCPMYDEETKSCCVVQDIRKGVQKRYECDGKLNEEHYTDKCYKCKKSLFKEIRE